MPPALHVASPLSEAEDDIAGLYAELPAGQDVCDPPAQFMPSPAAIGVVDRKVVVLTGSLQHDHVALLKAASRVR